MIFDRYLFRTVLAATLVVLLVLVALESLFLLLREADALASGELSGADLFKFIVLSAPESLAQVMPMAFLLGGLMGMGALASGSELVVMRASGVRVVRLVLAALSPGVLLAALAFGISEYVAPELSQEATRVLATAKGRSLAIREGKGYWARDGKTFIQARQMTPDGKIEDLLIFELGPEFQIEALTHAERAAFVDGSWQLQSLVSTLISDDRTRVEHQPTKQWNVDISPRLLKVLALEPMEMSLRDLTVYISYLRRNGLDSGSHRLAWWTKLLAPGTNLIMLFIAMPLVFAGARNASAGKRLFVGILLGLLYFLINRTMGGVALVYGVPPLLSATLPPAIFLVGGAVAMLKVR